MTVHSCLVRRIDCQEFLLTKLAAVLCDTRTSVIFEFGLQFLWKRRTEPSEACLPV
jgi:hypothetical protein